MKWLPDARETQWEPLGTAMGAGLPVPGGFIVLPGSDWEELTRAAYEELKIREKTHFVAVRASSHAALNIIGSDALINTLRRFWTEAADAPILIQRMIHSMWCGKAHWHRKNLRIRANEGMLILDPDVYLVNSSTGKCIRSTLEPKQRKMIRHVDGTAKVVAREGERTPMAVKQLAKIAELAVRASSNIGWSIDDSDRVWLISVS